MARPEDQIMDDLVNQGIGNSGLASRAIGQANLADLGAAINESNATRGNLVDARKYDLMNQVSKNRIDISSMSRGRAAGDDSAEPRAFVKIRDTRNPGGTGKRVYDVRNAGTDVAGHQFENAADFQTYIKANPLLAGRVAIQGFSMSAKEQEALGLAGARVVSGPEARQLSGKKTPGGLLPFLSKYVKGTGAQSLKDNGVNLTSVMNAQKYKQTLPYQVQSGAATANWVSGPNTPNVNAVSTNYLKAAARNNAYQQRLAQL